MLTEEPPPREPVRSRTPRADAHVGARARRLVVWVRPRAASLRRLSLRPAAHQSFAAARAAQRDRRRSRHGPPRDRTRALPRRQARATLARDVPAAGRAAATVLHGRGSRLPAAR